MRTTIAYLAILAALFATRLNAAELLFNTAVTYTGSDGTRRIHNFSQSSGALVENRFDGSTWQWIDHPAPSDKFGSNLPVALTWEEDGTQRIYVFAIAGNGHRFVTRYFNGTQWDWAQLPTASYLSLTKFAALTYVDELGKRRIELFGINDPGTFNGLVRTWWDGSAWHTQAIYPMAQAHVGRPVAVTFSEKGAPRIEVFCTVDQFGRTEGSLYSYSLQRGTWRWKDLGFQDFRPRSAITFKDAGDPRHIQLFGHKTDHSLTMYDWDGTSWTLLDLGKPGSLPAPDVAPITYMSEGGLRQTFLATTYDDRLYFKRRDGTSWSSYASFPPGTQFANDPTWIFYPDPRSGNDNLQMFVSSADGLMRHRWNGTNWQSYDQGAP